MFFCYLKKLARIGIHASVSDNHFKSNFAFLFGWILIIILHFIEQVYRCIELPKLLNFKLPSIFKKDQTVYVYLKLGLLLVWHGEICV